MDFEVWNFPHVDSLAAKPVLADHNAESSVPEPKLSPEELQRQAEHQQLMLRMTESLQSIGAISNTLSSQLQEVNEELLLKTTQLIKRIVEKVIQKEVHVNNEQMADKISQALKEIHQDNEPSIINIAPQHYEFLSTLTTMPAGITFKADAALKEGDFRIKTAYSELESILEKYLNEIFGLTHL
jgi:flagellar biosynthesis/type III secretory pathway protein FliH